MDLSVQEYAFIAVGAVGTAAAVRLVTTKNVVHGALYLVVALAAVGAAFLVLGAEFLGWVQVLIYVGAIVVLFLFGLMLTKAPIGRYALDNQQRGIALLVALAIFVGLVLLVQGAFPDTKIDPAHVPASEVGESLFRNYILPFEAMSFLLLAALIGAVVLARKDGQGR